MGVASARAGRRTLVVEVAGEQRMSRLFRSARVRPDRPTELLPGLFGLSVDADHATEEYLAGQLRLRPLVELLVHSRAFHHFTSAAPGLAELVTLGKIWTMAVELRGDGRAPAWDRLIVDCPATGHGIALLETAGNVEELAASGPIRDQAARINEVVTHPAATGIAVVAQPEEMAVTEAVEAAATLRGHGLPVAAAVLNGVREGGLADADARALRTAAENGDPAARAAAGAALRRARRAGADRAHLERLGAGTGLPVITLPAVVSRRFDLAAVERLADALPANGGRPEAM